MMRTNDYPIIIRMDDIWQGMDRNKFIRYVEFFGSVGIKPLLGVIPLNEDKTIGGRDTYDAFYSMIGDLVHNRGYSVAMHGVHHVYTSNSRGLNTCRRKSEFAGLSVDEQRQLLELGKKELEQNGVYTDIFMPPGHSYDYNTLKALYSTGFRYLTDGMSLMPYSIYGIKCIPADSAYRLHRFGILTVCIHSETDDFERISAFLEANLDNVIEFSDAYNIREISYFKARAQEVMRLLVRGVISKIAS